MFSWYKTDFIKTSHSLLWEVYYMRIKFHKINICGILIQQNAERK